MSSEDYITLKECLEQIITGYDVQFQGTDEEKKREMTTFQVRQGICLQRLGKYEEAEKKLLDVLQHGDFENTDLKASLCMSLQICYIEQNKVDEAMALLRQH